LWKKTDKQRTIKKQKTREINICIYTNWLSRKIPGVKHTIKKHEGEPMRHPITYILAIVLMFAFYSSAVVAASYEGATKPKANHGAQPPMPKPWTHSKQANVKKLRLKLV
jgi:hypothetical protein